MYSIVLATMLTAGTAAPANGFFHHSCHGGCCGYSYCHGGCCGYSSCYGGCCGYSSCYGGCCGYSSCYGGCCGYSSCYGGGWSNWSSCYGSWSSCYGGCCGYSSGWSCGGAVVAPYGAVPVVQNVGSSAATVVIKAPADVKLTVNGAETKMTSVEQRFKTPDLERGRSYSYEMTATVQRDGKDVTVTRKVVVQAGQESTADFSDLAVAVGSNKAKVMVKMPADAKLFVDDVLSTARTFETPALEPGRKYSYNLTAEAVRGGVARRVSKRVEVEAGKQVEVDFKELDVVQAAAR